jgi:chromosome segregation protein
VALEEITAQQPALEAARDEAEAAAREATDSTLPEKESLLRVAQQAVGEAQRAVSQLDQARQVNENSLGHTRRQIEQLDQRHRRLEQEQAQLPRPDAAGLATKQLEADELAQALAAAQDTLREAETALPALDAERTQTQLELDAARKALHQTEAELAALNKLQESLKADEKLGAWLRDRGLDAAPRLWETLAVEPGWEAAVEAVLRERLQAVAATTQPDWFADAPPARLSVWQGSGDARAPLPDSLAARVHCDAPAVRAVLADWLAGVRGVDDAAAAETARAELHPGECLVTREGHLFHRHSVTFHGPHTAVEGVLARGRELDRLAEDAARLHEAVAALEAATAHAQQRHAERQREIQALRAQSGHTQSRHHTAQMELLRLQQAVERVQSRAAQIAQELDEIRMQQEEARAGVAMLEERLAAYRSEGGPRARRCTPRASSATRPTARCSRRANCSVPPSAATRKPASRWPLAPAR